MLVLVVALCILSLLLAGYLIALMAELRRMDEGIAAAMNGGGREVYTLTRNPRLRQLAVRINGLMRAQKQRENRLRRADEAFKESVTGISHDLRTPLTSVSGYLQMLGSERTPPEKKAEYLSIIERRLAALLTLLDELFAYTKLELDTPAKAERLNPAAVLLEQMAMYYEDFERRGMTPAIEVPEALPAVFCDRGNLERIFQNLIKNTMAHAKGAFAVSAGEADGVVRVVFQNQVEGTVDPARLFDRFYTGDKSRAGKSTGLGLAIVKGLCEGMNGQVGAELVGDALRITVQLPKAK